MSRRIFAVILATVLVFAASVAVTAAPYTDIKIGYGKSIIYATDFDSDDYYETGTDGDYTARPEMEEAGGPQTESGNIGWINAGEWVQYTVNVEVGGKYKFEAHLASGSGTPGNVELYYNDELIGASENARQEDWQAYDLFEVGEIDMTAGTHVIKAVFPTGNLNISEIEVTALFDSPPEPEPEAAAPEANGGETGGDETPADANNDDAGSNDSASSSGDDSE
ncbi:MAG: carbohydrate-binding protein, partial [Oscillospiraceae bacterium]|nr:carbohydrate-binding protein [Oscillospiraceae bacterium]